VTQLYVGIQLSFVAFLSVEVNYLEREASFLAVSFGYGRDNSQSILSIRQLPVVSSSASLRAISSTSSSSIEPFTCPVEVYDEEPRDGLI